MDLIVGSTIVRRAVGASLKGLIFNFKRPTHITLTRVEIGELLANPRYLVHIYKAMVDQIPNTPAPFPEQSGCQRESPCLEQP